MGQTRKHYTAEFKVEALRLAETSGKPDAELERDEPRLSGTLATGPGPQRQERVSGQRPPHRSR